MLLHLPKHKVEASADLLWQSTVIEFDIWHPIMFGDVQWMMKLLVEHVLPPGVLWCLWLLVVI